MFERVDGSVEICPFDGVNSCGVYVGFLTDMTCVTKKLNWRLVDGDSKIYAIPYRVLTLDEIREQCANYSGLIIVVREGALGGDILQYGNHGERWEVVGELGGYA